MRIPGSVPSRLVVAIGLAAVALAGGTRPCNAGDDPAPARADPLEPNPPLPFVLSTIEGDPSGHATRLDASAGLLLAGVAGQEPDPVAAAQAWMKLAESDEAALLPVSKSPWDYAPTTLEDGLLWPAAEVAFTRLALLPSVGRDVVEARWGPVAGRALVEAIARAGRSPAALEEIATRYPVTEAGANALLLCAELRLEAGDDAEAARHLWRWLRLRHPPIETPNRVASVVARLFDALVRLEDARGVAALSRVCLLVPGATTRVNGVQFGVEDLTARAVTQVRARIARRPVERRLEPTPIESTHLWSLEVGDPNLVGGAGISTGRPTARVAVEGDAIYVCDARRVRRVDRWTGLVRWAYPTADPLPRDYDPAGRSRSFESPIRDVVIAGGLVLAVLGSPPVSTMATFRHDGGIIHGAHLARETRTRIVALDAVDGRPVWWSGSLDETDPIVGAADVAIASPLLVEHDSVSAVVSARRGAVECWLATFELATGRVRRTTRLGRSESGLALPASIGAERTLEEGSTRGLPRAERPVRSGDEIAVVTGAGFVAGVGARSGSLRWVQALPRYTEASVNEGESGDELPAAGIEHAFSPHNEPMPGFGSWFVAAEDARFAVSIEAGTGRQRWVAFDARRAGAADWKPPEEEPPEPPEGEPPGGFVMAPHLVGFLSDREGRAGIALAGGLRALEARDVATGKLLRDAGAESWRGHDPWESSDIAGRPLRIGSSLVAVRGGRLRALDGGSAPLDGWTERADRPLLPSGAGDIVGDVVHADGVWIVVGPERVVAIADAVAAVAAAKATGRDAADRAARACLLARVAPSREALTAAVAASASESAVRDQLLPFAVDALLPRQDGVALVDDEASLTSLRVLVDGLDVAARARAYRNISLDLERRGQDACLVELLDAWMPFGHRAVVDAYGGRVESRIRVRSDLYAGERLPAAAARSAKGRAALARREQRAESQIATAMQLGESALVEAIRRAGGTRAAWLARFDLLALRIDAGRFHDAASTAADLRTSAPDFRGPSLAHVGVDLGSAAAHALRGLEADLHARMGEMTAAREALFDADRDGPALARTLDGGPAALLAQRIGRWSSGPTPDAEADGRLELFSGDRTPSEQARLEVAICEPSGPGASGDLDRVVVGRGVGFEIRSLSTGAVVPVTPIDTAFLGATMQDRETSVPGSGVRIASVIAGQAADRAGLRAGDWILRWGNDDAIDRGSLVRRVAQTPAGSTVRVVASRHGRRFDVDVMPGRRTTDDRSPSISRHAEYSGDGTAIVASRFGLARVDLETGVATPIWRSHVSGQVVETLGFSGTLFASVATSPLGDTTVVAVDAATGTERWATAIEGATSSPPRVVGSALVVDTHEPSRTWILDRASGSLRATYARSMTSVERRRRFAHASEPQGSVDSGGAVWLWRDGVKREFLTSVDPASGMARLHRQPAVVGGLLPHPLAGGGLVAAAATSDTMEVYLPDLRGGVESFGTLHIDGPRFGTQTCGALDFLSRIAVGGDSIYIARITGEKRAVLGAVEIDRRALRGLALGDSVIWHPGDSVLRPQASVTSNRSDVWPVFASMRATIDGAWACATYWDVGRERAAGASVWYEPANHETFVSVRTESSLLYASGPVWLGSRVFVPTDGGYVVWKRRDTTRR